MAIPNSRFIFFRPLFVMLLATVAIIVVSTLMLQKRNDNSTIGDFEVNKRHIIDTLINCGLNSSLDLDSDIRLLFPKRNLKRLRNTTYYKKLAKQKAAALRNIKRQASAMADPKFEAFFDSIVSIDKANFNIDSCYHIKDLSLSAINVPFVLRDSNLPNGKTGSQIQLHFISQDASRNVSGCLEPYGFWYVMIIVLSLFCGVMICFGAYCIFYRQPSVAHFNRILVEEQKSALYYIEALPLNLFVVILVWLAFFANYISPENWALYANYSPLTNCTFLCTRILSLAFVSTYLTGFLLSLLQIHQLKLLDVDKKNVSLIQLQSLFSHIKQVLSLYNKIMLVFIALNLLALLSSFFAINETGLFRAYSDGLDSSALPYFPLFYSNIIPFTLYIVFYAIARFALKALPDSYKIKVI